MSIIVSLFCLWQHVHHCIIVLPLAASWYNFLPLTSCSLLYYHCFASVIMPIIVVLPLTTCPSLYHHCFASGSVSISHCIIVVLLLAASLYHCFASGIMFTIVLSLFCLSQHAHHCIIAVLPLTACPSLYHHCFCISAPESVPPLSLLEHVTSWVTSDCTLCCESIRQVPIHGTCSSPIPGLLSWCVLGPVVCTHLLNRIPTPEKPGSKSSKVCKDSLSKTLSILSKLHLGVLQSVDFCRSSSLTQCLLSVTDAACLVTQLSGLLQHVKVKSKVEEEVLEEEVVHLAMERLAQVLQVAKMAGCLMVQRGKRSFGTSAPSTFSFCGQVGKEAVCLADGAKR